MQILLDIIKGISFSGFSNFADSIISKLGFTKAIASFALSDVICYILLVVIFIGPKCLLINLKDISRSFTLKIHPTAVVNIKQKGKTVNPEKIESSSIHTLTIIATHIILMFILSFEASNFQEVLLTSAAILSNSGWILLIFGKTNILSSYSIGMQIFISVILILNRIKQIKILIDSKKLKKLGR